MSGNSTLKILGAIVAAAGTAATAWVTATLTSRSLEEKRKSKLDQENELIFKKMENDKK
ncbi:hypothetical protein MUN35_19900 [Hafnia paralvei]|uniref:hypothetical protein n=1 Tax=Hafnia paralvei TaxID=546367 RepID=UPI001FFE8C67|nr:hypothetical protein [Hafnia paralvei]MCK2181957.1 hypothetical protein [Hafnia paralvei]